ncbi:MAG: redoxin domain-containing protein [Gemmatimonadetes bacterium]|nr:redoxin domain-containing protein [Gemmatimonadota bacterium]
MEEPRRLPATMISISGETLSLPDLATDGNLVLVTLKAPWCPVCQEQLVRLRARLPELEACGVTFIVLAPGPAEALREIRERTGFPFPFVADEGLRIAEPLGLRMAPDQILPCMFQVLPDRTVGWRQMGRNGAYFGDRELGEFFDCTGVV